MKTKDPDAATPGESSRTLRDPSLILAYLEDLVRTGEEVGVAVQGHATLPARLEAVGVEPPRLKVHLGQPLPVTWIRRKEILLSFSMDGVCLQAPVRFLERADYLEAVFSMPESVARADRRSRVRVRFGPREKATVTVLEGLVGARGATGPLVDLSMGGLCMRLDRAINLRGKDPLAVSPATFPRGTHFPVVRIDQLPHAPILVCAGVVAHIQESAGGILMGLQFQDLGDLESQIIRQVLGRRLPGFDATFPDRRRSDEHIQDPRVTVVHHAPEPVPPGTGTDREDRRILLAVGDDLDRAILATSLRLAGFRRIHEARSLAQALDHVRVFPMDLVVAEERMGSRGLGEVLSRLRQNGLGASVPLVLLAGADPERAQALARRAGVTHVLPGAEDLSDTFVLKVQEILA
jgi:CheY-like chemotaxis protein